MTYAGITIGPIYDTIADVSTPAALWFGSMLFSDLMKRICTCLMKAENTSINLYTPAFDAKDMDAQAFLSDGVGKYHDRAIFSSSLDADELKCVLDSIVDKVKADTAEIFNGCKLFINNSKNRIQEKDVETFLKEYLQIHYVIIPALEGASIGKEFLVINQYLDGLECIKTFPESDLFNPIAAIMIKPADRSGSKDQSAYQKNENDKESKDSGVSASREIKKSSLYKQIDKNENQLMKNSDGDIWEIADIASGAVAKKNADGAGLKYKNYYAVVKADADKMGDFLASIKDEDRIRLFSRKCLTHSEESARLIKKFGGMTIYAGGDDLLFLAPVKAGEDTVFSLCHDIADNFHKTLQQTGMFAENVIPTISFGISIQFIKSPLYEALNKADMLLRRAKEKKPKNNMAINLQKHSGQSTEIMVGNEFYDVFKELLEQITKVNSTGSEAEIIKNFSHQLDWNYALLSLMDSNAGISNSWTNLFDNEGQQGAEEFRDRIHDIYYEKMREMKDKNRIQSVEKMKAKGSVYTNKNLNALMSALQISKFLVEEADEREGKIIE